MTPPFAGGADRTIHAPESRFDCRLCGQTHRVVALSVGERARCAQCGAVMAKGARHGIDAALAFALSGLIFALPAALLPIVTVSKFANERAGVLFTGVAALWEGGMRMVAVWVLICGALTPVLLLGAIVALALPLRFGWASVAARPLATAARVFEHWAMPEVHVLAMLVALIKLHTLVGVSIGPGFWCYAAMSFLTLLAWNNFDLAGALPAAPAQPAP